MSIYYWLIIVTLATPTWSEHTRVKSIECHSFDPENIHIRSCILKPVGRGVKDVYVVIKLPKEPVTNATVRLELKHRGYDKPVLYSFTVDACRFMSASNRNILANAFYKFLKFDVYTNLNHSCPFTGELIIDHLRFDKNFNFPVRMSLGNYKLMSYWYTYNVLRITIQLNFEITA
ncbi:uncharacterized protein LOC122757648 [Drosophila mojavensis]|uniref:MD-2-related lipid-recognition domain-containing protein n=1 Tax=Drosophila mojavensis TaxID=7230 RepID=A0A0Q9X7G5_DROMO|nr:uncharacterized protein LOC122757648 [Drosophila mojavensis]KRG04188.1 uncharacterized protein Dmoj_GI25896 [Drosophila mojavensis]